MESNLNPTIKEYLNDTYLFNLNNVELIKIEEDPKDPNSFYLVFDKTVFHPQGGGQPSDEGNIKNTKTGVVYEISGVTHDRERDIVLHKLSKQKYNQQDFTKGDTFDQTINEEKRRLFAKLHSGMFNY